MERANENSTDAVVDLGAIVAETRGGNNLPRNDGIGNFGGAGLSDD